MTKPNLVGEIWLFDQSLPGTLKVLALYQPPEVNYIEAFAKFDWWLVVS